MEETNVTMTTEETQGEPAAKENETKAEKFIRIGEYRMNKAVDAIGRLENLANRSCYEYTQEQVDAMFQALEGRVVIAVHGIKFGIGKEINVVAFRMTVNCNRDIQRSAEVIKNNGCRSGIGNSLFAGHGSAFIV